MVAHRRRMLAVGILSLAICGCGGSDQSLSPGIMTAAMHSHYHVHAVDASHEHAHQNQSALGAHTHSHSHQHPDHDTSLQEPIR